ncbi:HAMP domain-containing histidine kinase [Polaribacter sp. Z014]|uniref:sensor histidine kinase n=1 Tax=Polaribacter sp. Z014 TaxID=2927126 RepID=UPI0020212CA6|nr:HAMP domain-containing sensor histidine kinase [Polaribacter sp. Z014]MCL7765004.1 HAMP domain-containing histidine kinase [Polaribacter sp. Z014]
MSKKVTLLKKTSKTFLLTGFILAFLSAVILYFYTKNLLKSEIEEELYSTEARVINALKNGSTSLSLPPVTEVIITDHLKSKVLKDTLIYDPSQDEMELFRELSTFKKINGKNYKITVRNLVVESESFLVAIVISNILILVATFMFLFYFNRKKNLKLWHPFFKNLEQMKHFSLTSKEPIALIDSDVLEFSELKNEIILLTEKVKTDYENLKQFSENVSHEMQTPLAIIQAKIDNLINEHGINDKQFVQVTSIQKDIQRLKQLNKKITILTKIDNHQFINIEVVNLTKLINEKIENFKELKQVHLSLYSEKELTISMDSYLADILINNLISNAIKHSKKEEEITVYTNGSILSISNFGDKALVNPENIFLRFYKESNRKHSTGLGLAIVKKICDFYGFTPSYSFKEHQHIFSVRFK